MIIEIYSFYFRKGKEVYLLHCGTVYFHSGVLIINVFLFSSYEA